MIKREALLASIKSIEEGRQNEKIKNKRTPVHDWLRDHTLGAEEFGIIDISRILVHLSDECER